MRTKIITSTESKQGGVRNHVKLGVFSKGTVLCGGCWLWAWQMGDCRLGLPKG